MSNNGWPYSRNVPWSADTFNERGRSFLYFNASNCNIKLAKHQVPYERRKKRRLFSDM